MPSKFETEVKFRLMLYMKARKGILSPPCGDAVSNSLKRGKWLHDSSETALADFIYHLCIGKAMATPSFSTQIKCN